MTTLREGLQRALEIYPLQMRCQLVSAFLESDFPKPRESEIMAPLGRRSVRHGYSGGPAKNKPLEKPEISLRTREL